MTVFVCSEYNYIIIYGTNNSLSELIQVAAHADSNHNQYTDDVENECPNLRRLGRHGPINSVNHQKGLFMIVILHHY